MSVDSRTGDSLRLWVVMNRALRSIESHLRAQVESHGISFTEFAVLEVLLHREPLPIGDIGDKILRSSGSMTYVLDKLEKRNLIRRRECASDRRITYAELTRPGKDLIRRVFGEHETLLADLTQVLSVEELRQTANRLKRLGLYARSHHAEPA